MVVLYCRSSVHYPLKRPSVGQRCPAVFCLLISAAVAVEYANLTGYVFLEVNESDYWALPTTASAQVRGHVGDTHSKGNCSSPARIIRSNAFEIAVGTYKQESTVFSRSRYNEIISITTMGSVQLLHQIVPTNFTPRRKSTKLEKHLMVWNDQSRAYELAPASRLDKSINSATSSGIT